MKKVICSLSASLFLWGSDGAKVFFDLNTGVEAYRYEEKSLMNISGPMYRVDATFGLSTSFFKTQLEGYYAGDMGRNVYDGVLLIPNTASGGTSGKIPYSTQSKDWYVGGNFKFGYFFSSQMGASSFVYSGVGYRFLRNNRVNKPVEGYRARSYQRDQSYLYLPVGIDVEIPITHRISFTAMTEYRFFLNGKNRSAFSQLGYDNDIIFTQKDGFGGRIGIGLKFNYAKMGMNLGLYYDHWFVDDSDKQPLYQNGAFTNLIFVEPKNSTKAIGLMTGISF